MGVVVVGNVYRCPAPAAAGDGTEDPGMGFERSDTYRGRRVWEVRGGRVFAKIFVGGFRHARLLGLLAK
jgi:hypothetical protein